MRTTILTATLIVICTMSVTAQSVQGKPWTDVIPDPDSFDWTSNNRPGYRYRGMEPVHERFYDYIEAKRERGEELSMADNAMIRRLQAARRWPEGPVPNEFWKSFLRYLREQPDLSLNFAQGFMFNEAMARGLIPMDRPKNEDMRKAVEYLNSKPFRARNWFERCFGRVEPWMDYYAASRGVDMTADGSTPSGVFPPDGDFNGLRIHYDISGVKLNEPTDSEGFTTRRKYTGTVAPGTITISGSGSLDSGRRATLEVHLQIGDARINEEWTFDAPGSKDFDFTVEIPADADLTFPPPQFWIELTGHYSTAGRGSAQTTRGLVVSARLEEDPAAKQARHDRSDAEWRAQVEKTLRELGYEQTQAGREIEQMRQAIDGGDAAWKEYVDRKQRELGYQDAGPEAGFDELNSALQTGGQTWQQYAAARGGSPPSAREDVGGLQVGTGTDGGTTTGAADSFAQVSKVCAALTYQNQQAGSTAVAVWQRDGEEITRSQQTLGGANGWVTFNLFTQAAGGLQPGRYTLTITVGDTVLGRRTFTIEGAN